MYHCYSGTLTLDSPVSRFNTRRVSFLPQLLLSSKSCNLIDLFSLSLITQCPGITVTIATHTSRMILLQLENSIMLDTNTRQMCEDEWMGCKIINNHIGRDVLGEFLMR
ncbi:uncharacterized protein LOC142556405 [Primulina tabacum]|uniref:uncharacterized protein LOC142556405 n=1 Tax=Primulina tabacum TaxID=48773 RepID=UPI003F599744